MNFFEDIWFPQVKSATGRQNGFISIESDRDKKDGELVNITLKFADWETLNAWVDTKVHDELVDGLDPYRTRNWEVAKIEKNNDQEAQPSELVWEQITPTQTFL